MMQERSGLEICPAKMLKNELFLHWENYLQCVNNLF